MFEKLKLCNYKWSESYKKKLLYRSYIKDLRKAFFIKGNLSNKKDSFGINVLSKTIDLIQAIQEEMYNLFPEEKIMEEAYNTEGIPEGFIPVKYEVVTVYVNENNRYNTSERLKTLVTIKSPLIKRTIYEGIYTCHMRKFYYPELNATYENLEAVINSSKPLLGWRDIFAEKEGN